ncbi:FAD-dependent monooxygenase [Moraxella sp. Tifton1]|uniref:FAD-dependent monooxygenase n=1 Tax=Moraxella oculi TaxID=2940516 RepID=UPI00201200D2|nr:FAD-dependent monooxygenase [Moraxella sp. Tifton1]MCL1622695.1 FAD-dependent monooxygenase [Moraxella sp. Tifton1]
MTRATRFSMKFDEMMHLQTEVLIVGGGVVGKVLAIGLAGLKKSVTLIDMKPKLTSLARKQRLSKRDARVYALNLASLNLLTHVGVHQFIRHADYVDMQVWQGDGRGELRFKKSHDAKILGSMVEPSVIDEALDERAGSADIMPFLTILNDTMLDESFDIDVRTTNNDGLVTVIVRQQDKKILIETKLLVGADGRESAVRRMSGIQTDRLDYHQTAICCAIHTTKPHGNTARQAMLNTGTLALLPLADMSADDAGCWQSVVWTLPTKLAKTYLSLSTDELAQKLALASSFELGEIVAVESVASFALSAQVAKSHTAPRTLLMGDAAHGVHPLAGQGLNLGLADVQALLDLMECCDLSDNHQNARLLRRYERARRAKNALMMHSFSLINHVFVGDVFQREPMRFIRSEMVSMTGKIRPLMEFFNKKASGF